MASKRILIVEDDPDVRRGLGIRLQASDYNVVLASDAQSGIAQAQQQPPDLIILDLGLPGADGYAVLHQLSQSGQLASIPVIVLSALNRYAHEERVRSAGAKMFCQKPVDDDELLGRIQRLLIPSARQTADPSDGAAQLPHQQEGEDEDGNQNINSR
jgi:DNA-binding response OmpR family regulator